MNRNFSRIVTMLALFVWPLALVLALAAPAAAQGLSLTATAQLMDQMGQPVGTATFTETSSGVRVQVQVNGLMVAGNPLPAGPHGIHVHQTASCVAPDFESAGEHFNPLAKDHGMDNPDGEHAGDLPNITFEGNGNASYDQTSKMFMLSAGELSVFDTDGSAIVIHENPDDYMTGPSGKSGARVACGVLVKATTNVGMPNTGNGAGGSPLWPIALGAVLALAGGVVTLRSRKYVVA